MLLFSGCIVFPLFLFPPLSFCFCELVLFMVAYFSDSLLFIFSEAVMGFCFVVFKAYIKLLIFFLKMYLLTFGCALLLHRLFSSFREWGLLSRCSMWASHCGVFFCCELQALGVQAPVVVAWGLNSWGPQALEHRLSSCGTWT